MRGLHRGILAGGWALLLCLAIASGCASSGSSKTEQERDLAQRQAVAHYNLGVHHLSKGSTALAIRELREAVEKNPDDPWIHLALAEGYRRKAKLEEAESHLLRTLAIDPNLHNAQLNLSALYVQMGRNEEAVVYARRLVEDATFPAPWRAHTNLGYALFQLGRHAEARAEFELALDYRPYFWRALLDLAILDAAEGHKLAAIEKFQGVLEMKPGPLAEAEVYYRIGELYVSLGRREDAVAHLSQATERRPSGNWGRRSEEYLKLLQ
jgi:tetratricopeptide (TPR) repeat protein